MKIRYALAGLTTAALVAAMAPGIAAQAAPGPNGPPSDAAATAAYWTPERRAAATPRDIVVDARGQSYLRGPDGLRPYGPASPQLAQKVTQVGTPTPQPLARPGGGGSNDTTKPVIGTMDPAAGATIGASHTFTAVVTDIGGSGVKSVSFSVGRVGGVATNFAATRGTGDIWSATLQGFTDGNWEWRVTAKDYGAKGGNTQTSGWVRFKVSTSGGGGGGGAVVTNAEWTEGGSVQTTAGRLYFEMPANVNQTQWSGYVCSGTVADDRDGDRSIIVTAAHCVYDDAHKAFARNVMFIPNQDGTSAAGTDRTCSNDPLGCWTASYGVVDSNWTTRTWPYNIPWDYAYYVVLDTGAHTPGLSLADESLQKAVGGGQVLPFSDPSVGATVAALGYSYSDDPNLMYCSEGLATSGTANWWLPSCGLSGGSSGGPWLKTVSGNGEIFSVNSWGYSNQPGMAGPKLATSSAQCVFNAAMTAGANLAATCPTP